MTAVEIRALDVAHAQKAVDVLNGRTYHNLKAYYYSYPCKGNEFVVVSTEDDITQLQLMKLAAGLLMDELK